jgi:transcriptional regulator with GAF, ATPase, and Fis domain
MISAILFGWRRHGLWRRRTWWLCDAATKRAHVQRIAALEAELRTRQDAERDARARASLSFAVTRALNRRSELRTMLQRSADALVSDLPCSLARIWTLNRTYQLLEIGASAGTRTIFDGPLQRIAIGSFTVGIVAHNRASYVAAADQVDPPLGDPDWMRREGLVAFAAYPLLVDTTVVGVLAIATNRPLSPAALETVASVADCLAHGIERKRVEGELARKLRDLEEAHDLLRRQARDSSRTDESYSERSAACGSTCEARRAGR